MKDPFQILAAHVGYGTLSLSGDLGYERRKILLPPALKNHHTISAHADSRVLIRTETNLQIHGLLNSSATEHKPTHFFVDGSPLNPITGPGQYTNPIVIFPGDHLLEIHSPTGFSTRHTIWTLTETNIAADVPRRIKTSEGRTGARILVSTVMTPGSNPGYFNLLKQSCEHWNVDLLLTNTRHPFVDYNWNKLQVYYRELRRLKDEFDTVIFLDGADAFLARHPADADAAFRALGGNVLCSAEIPCAPWHNWHHNLLPPSPTPYRYACAGMWMADRRALPELMEVLGDVSVDLSAVPVYQEQNLFARTWDQINWNELAARRWPLLKLDYNCDVFFNLQPGSESHIDYREGEVRNKITGTQPCCLHGPGPGKYLLHGAFKTIYKS